LDIVGMLRNPFQVASSARSSLICRRFLHASRPAQQIFDSILDTVGNTPVVRLNRLPTRKDVTVYAKCEFFNPLSSVKDRLAVAIIEHGERTGRLKPGMTVVEATSGNTGIALAMVCAQKGYPCVITMAESFSIERRKVMRALGAQVVLTPAALKGTGMVKKAAELAEAHGWFLSSQFETEANAAFHASTTGPEILRDFAGKRLDYWVTGYGTGGTYHGAGKMIKTARPEVKIVLAEPDVAPLIASGMPQSRLPTGAPAETHPAFTPHPIQGWTPDFIPKVLAGGLELGLHDQLIPVSGAEGIATALQLGAQEGIFTGISGGASMAVALKVAADAPSGSVIVAMLADTAERYLSTPLFAGVLAEMNEAELATSMSTPYAQLPPPAN